LESGPLSDPAFPQFSAKVVPFVHVTTRLKDRKYEGLLKEKGFNAFPSLAFLDAEGNVLLVQQARTVAQFEKSLAAVTEWDTVRNRIAKGEKGLEYDLFVADWNMGKMDFPTAKSRAATLKNLQPMQQSQVDQILLDAEVLHLSAAASKEEGFEPAAKRFLEILKAGKPMPSAEAEVPFWNVLMHKAEQGPVNPDLYEQALKVFERVYGGNPKRQDTLQKMRDRLAEMRKGRN